MKIKIIRLEKIKRMVLVICERRSAWSLDFVVGFACSPVKKNTMTRFPSRSMYAQ